MMSSNFGGGGGGGGGLFGFGKKKNQPTESTGKRPSHHPLCGRPSI
jgi:hypothetical protein